MLRALGRVISPLVLVLAGCGLQPAPSDGPEPSAARTPEPTVPTMSRWASPSATAVAHWTANPAAVDRIGDDLAALQEIADANGGVRAAGTPGYEASVDWAAARLEDIGFAVSTPEVAFTGFRDLGATLAVGDRRFTGPDEVRALIYSAGGRAEGPIAVLDESGCDRADFDGVERGSVVLTTGGGCYRRQQALNAIDAGAVALVVGYPGRGAGEIFRPTLISPDGIDIPVISVTRDAVAALEAGVGDPAAVDVAVEREPAAFRNVIGELGAGPRTLMLGAHLDSVLDGPGINDNGSGVAALLEVGRTLAAAPIPDGWAVRIGFWGAEEFGSYGSRDYVEGLDDRDMVAYLNLDMAGSVNGATLVYDEPTAAPGSDRITAAYAAWLAARQVAWDPVDLGGGSDHAAFAAAGVPTGGLFAGATAAGGAAQPSTSSGGPDPDPCYHIGCDDLDNVDVVRVALFNDATAAVALDLMAR